MSGHWRLFTKDCAHCGQSYQGRTGQLYCDQVCTQRAYRARRTARYAVSYTEGQIVAVLGEVLPSTLDALIDTITEKLRAL